MVSYKGYPPEYVIELSRQLRLEMTECENILWSCLQKRQVNGFKFRRQHPVNRYIVDFYCCKKRLAIEVNGEVHRRRKDYDNYRDRYLAGAGIKVLRFNNREIRTSLKEVLGIIEKALSG